MIFVYFLFSFLVVLFFNLDYADAKLLYRWYKGDEIDWIMLAVLIIVKILLGFFGRLVRPVLFIFFGLDCIVTAITTLNFLFLLDSYKTDDLDNNYDDILVIIITMLFFSSMGSLIAPMFNPDLRYNYLMTFGTMTLLACFAIILCITILANVNTPKSWYTNCLFFVSAINFYICYNNELVLKYRSDDFFIDDTILNFYAYSTDWFSYFPSDIILNSKVVVKIIKIRQQRETEATERLKSTKRKNQIEKKKATINKLKAIRASSVAIDTTEDKMNQEL